MKCLLSLLVLVLGSVAAGAQEATATVACPVEFVCLTRDAAEKLFVKVAGAKAFETENEKLKLAIDGDPNATDEKLKLGYKGVIHKTEVEFARVSGEYSGFKQGAVRVDAAFDTAIKNTKKSCKPFSILCL